MSDTSKLIGARLRSLREQRGWSQEQLSVQAQKHVRPDEGRKGASIARTTISKIENGHRLPDMWVLEACAIALGVTLAELFGSAPLNVPAQAISAAERDAYLRAVYGQPAKAPTLSGVVHDLRQLSEAQLAQVLPLVAGILQLTAGVPAAHDKDELQLERVLASLSPEERGQWLQALQASLRRDSALRPSTSP